LHSVRFSKMIIKRLYSYLLKNYLGTFIATFCVCLFIVLMQFLWKYVDDMVGKGLPASVLLQFFYYAALSLVPMALPLSILLSSLITFGDLGERLELLAMKASGISLFRIMRPFIFFVICVSIGAFFYSDNALPYIQKQLYILAKSMSEKSPEVQIPEGSFYQGIPNVSVYVKHKDPNTRILKDVMIYDFSNVSGAGENSASDNISIICADSARLQTTSDKEALLLTLYNGETFENMRQQKANSNKSIPYRRESFGYKQVLIDFNGAWKKVDASVTNNKYVGKNMAQLTQVVDSLGVESKKLGDKYARTFVNERYFGRIAGTKRVHLSEEGDCSSFSAEELMAKQSKENQKQVLDDALAAANQLFYECDFMFGEKDYSVDRNARRHDIERHRKVTMSVACLLFFFIGAPLGAIIRKGGLGLPIVISVIIFILYYIIDNTGYKMAREGLWYVWNGIWLSSAVLLPLGMFLTYKAATDSMVNLNKNTIRKLLHLKKKEQTEQ
jgi:lipopolysaccharide export system permease protein